MNESTFKEYMSNADNLDIKYCQQKQQDYIWRKLFHIQHINEIFGSYKSYSFDEILFWNLNKFININKNKLISKIKCQVEDLGEEINLIYDKKPKKYPDFDKYHAYIVAEHKFVNKYIIKVGFYHYQRLESLDAPIYIKLDNEQIKFGIEADPAHPIIFYKENIDGEMIEINKLDSYLVLYEDFNGNIFSINYIPSYCFDYEKPKKIYF